MSSWHDDGVAARWSGFPGDVSPRPIVLLDDRVLVEDGFVDGDSKLAWPSGAIEAGVPVPGDVPALLPQRRASPVRTVLTITGVSAVTALFRCDRAPESCRRCAWT